MESCVSYRLVKYLIRTETDPAPQVMAHHHAVAQLFAILIHGPKARRDKSKMPVLIQERDTPSQ